MDHYSYSFPTEIRFGPGVVNELGQHLQEHDKQKPLIVTDSICVTLPFFQEIIDHLKIQPIIFDAIHKNPVKSDVEKGTEQYHQSVCDSIVGIGGGAPLDVARAIALQVNHPLDLFEYEEASGGDKLITGEIPYFIAIPTTSGTGSEVGRSCIISDDKTKQKKILFHPNLMAKKVFADPLLTLELPPLITAATGMDALTHHIESYLAKGFHPMCDGIALEGIRLIWENIETATHAPTVETRSHMMIAALMGAVAFQKGLGVVHSTAHPLSTMFDTHHGLANAIMLPFGLQFNASTCPEKMDRIAEIFGTHDVIDTIRELIKRLQLPSKLRELNVKENDLDQLAHLAFLDPCHQNNPRPVTEEDFRNIYQEAL